MRIAKQNKYILFVALRLVVFNCFTSPFMQDRASVFQVDRLTRNVLKPETFTAFL